MKTFELRVGKHEWNRHKGMYLDFVADITLYKDFKDTSIRRMPGNVKGPDTTALYKFQFTVDDEEYMFLKLKHDLDRITIVRIYLYSSLSG